MSLFRRDIRTHTLVGRISFVDASDLPIGMSCIPLGEKAMMRIILLISLHLSESLLSVSKIVRGDFGIPSVSLKLDHGYIGIALLQDDETGAKGEAVIHVSGIASKSMYIDEIGAEQQAAVESIHSIQASLGIANISWA